jgi:hypothetical protein
MQISVQVLNKNISYNVRCYTTLHIQYISADFSADPGLASLKGQSHRILDFTILFNFKIKSVVSVGLLMIINLFDYYFLRH